MKEQELRNQIEKLFSLNNIEEINKNIEELILNNKEDEVLIRKFYEYNKSLLFKNKTYDEIKAMYSTVEKLSDDLFKYLSEEEIVEKIKNSSKFSDSGVFVRLSISSKKEIQKIFITKGIYSPLTLIVSLNKNPNNINYYTSEELLDLIEQIPKDKFQILLTCVNILDVSSEVAGYIFNHCNLDNYFLDLDLNVTTQIEAIKHMSEEQLSKSKEVFKDLNEEVFDYMFNNFDASFLVKYSWGTAERNKKILDKLEKIDDLEDYYLTCLSETNDSKYVIEKLEKYNFKGHNNQLLWLFIKFNSSWINSREDLNVFLSNLENVEGEILNSYFSKFNNWPENSKYKEEFILNFLKKTNIEYETVEFYISANYYKSLSQIFTKYLKTTNYGIVYSLKDCFKNFSEERIPEIKELIASAKSFEGYEDILIKCLSKMNDVEFIVNKLKQFNVDIINSRKYWYENVSCLNDLLEKSPTIADIFCELFGLEDTLYLCETGNSLKYLLEKLEVVPDELRDIYLDKLANLSSDKSAFPFIIEKLCVLNFSPEFFGKYINQFLNNDNFEILKYLDAYGNMIEQKNILYNTIKQLYGIDIIYEKYYGNNIFVLREILNHYLGNELVNNLNDEEILSLKLDLSWLRENNMNLFIDFYKKLNNNPNLKEVINLFKNGTIFKDNLKNEIDEKKLLEIITDRKYLEFMINYFDKNELSEEINSVLADLDIFVKATGKTNFLEVNPVISYDFIKYIYRNLGFDFSIKLTKYNTLAPIELIDAIKSNEIDLVKFYIELYEKYNFFDENNRKENMAFLNFSSFKELLRDIKNRNLQLNELDVKNLKNIILSGNKYEIKTADDLMNYKNAVATYINKLLESEDLDYLKENIAKSFCGSYKDLKRKFYGYELSNFSKISEVSKCISDEEKNKLQLTQQEIKLILLLKNIINCDNIDKTKDLLNGLIDKGEIVDYRNDFYNLINKIRNIYGKSFNSVLTNIDKLDSPRDVKTIPGVTIIDLNGEKFNFYAHRLYSYDPKFRSFSSRLEADPSLWTKLEGASTLSTSCISDKGLHFLKNNNPNGVVYLFNKIPDYSMLFMYGMDLYVQHGGHQFEPTSVANKFTDFESLVQATNYQKASYNELALFREGIMPCAFACIGDTPNEATIRAAKYFSEFLKTDIPIIKLNPELYKKQNKEIRKNARKNFSSKATIQELKEIFYDGTGNIEEKIEFCLNELKLQYKNRIIDYKEYIQLLIAMERYINRSYDVKDNKNFKRKIQLLRQSICMINNLTEQEIIEIENANLGESGIIYKMQDGEKEYLLKPSVNQTSLKNEPFKAEIEKAASILQTIISPNTSVKVDVISEGPLRIAERELIEVDKEGYCLESRLYFGGNLLSNYTNQLLQEYVVDFLLCNFDCYIENYIIDSNFNIRGIDKEQSFKFIQDNNTLDPSFSYWPNGSERIPIYFKIFEEYKKGSLDLNLDVINECLVKVEKISDEDYIKIFEKYAEALDPENKLSILQMILERKKVCTQILKDYVVELQNSRNEGVKL